MNMLAGKKAIDKIYKRRDRYDIPEWQRGEVWDSAKKRLLIDSILKGWRLPKFYFLRLSDDPEEFEVVDGQQRLVAIFEFFGDELGLGPEAAQALGGRCYSQLPQARQDAFDDFEIEYDIIEDAEETEVKEFFQRLQTGLPLTSSEKLNSVHSNLTTYGRKLAKHSFFQSKVQLADKRYAHFDIVAKVAAIEVEGLDAGLRFEDMKLIFETQAGFSQNSQVAKRLQAGFDYLDKVFPARNSILRHRTIVQSFATLTVRLVSNGKATGYEQRLRAFFEGFIQDLSKQVELGARATDPDYILFQRTVTANVRSGARTRQEILLRKLLMADPTVAGLFDSSAIAEGGIPASVRQLGEAIAAAVHDLNSRYSATHGQDLFRLTNKTSKALVGLRKVVNGYEGYASLIDNLYFIFYEGPGSRMPQGSRTRSFSDISLLRNGLRHDMDHGSEAKARTKTKKIGEAFKRYAGAPSPHGLDPAQFPLVQANLYAAIERDLKAITV